MENLNKRMTKYDTEKTLKFLQRGAGFEVPAGVLHEAWGVEAVCQGRGA